tara:strand:- start:210 stop:710 length:501 start_codon:yes stop_codon:yes gene_type:complete
MRIFSRLVPNSIYDHKLRNSKKGKKFNYSGLKVKAKVVDIYDGDTLTLVFRYSGKLQQHSCRMIGYDSPEMRPSKNSPNREKEIEAAKIAREKLISWIGEPNLTTKLIDVKLHDFDKYGRILVDIYVDDRSKIFKCCGNGIHINQWMIDNGYGYAYDGGTKKAFSA